MTEWTAVAALDEVPAAVIYGAKAGDTKLILVKLPDGEVIACEDRCPHEGTALTELGDYDPEDELLICSKHLWEFEVRTGLHLSNLHLPDTNLTCFPVRIENGQVEVDLSRGSNKGAGAGDA